MQALKRTHTCGDLRTPQAGQDVILNGWVHRLRNFGGIVFFTLRDRYGMTQVVFDENVPTELKAKAESLKPEFSVAIKGKVRARPTDMINKDMPTGEIEVVATDILIYSTSPTLPFQIEDENKANENLRLQYRYLDLRNSGMQSRLVLRHKVAFAAREYLNSQSFLEIETPTLIKSTPEGARDFLVPSRINKGKFYALPQSPQLYKQLLMVGGMDRYYQIARCYRDEDARGDRQPEFTQIDVEMSYVTRDDVLAVAEGMMKHIFKQSMNYDLPIPFPRMAYDTALDLYGSDKPELRFDLPMQDFTPFVEKSSFDAFKGVVAAGGTVKAWVLPGQAEWASRKKIGELEEAAKTYGAKGLAWLKVTESGIDGGIAKFFADQGSHLITSLGLKPTDVVFFVADKYKTAVTSLGAVRLKAGRELGMADPKAFNFLWVVDFPLFEYNEEEKAWEPAHHMFSMPQAQYIPTLESDPGSVKGDLYDMVCNGLELASGSIRIHDPALQQRVFNIVGFPEELAKQRFGFLLESFKYGPPPHGGFAPGLDRLVMIMTGQETIREVIAFPKNTQAASPMDESPSEVDAKQVADLGLIIKV